MQFRRITGGKLRPEEATSKRSPVAAAYYPKRIAAAGQHIDPERLPDSPVGKVPNLNSSARTSMIFGRSSKIWKKKKRG
jgi:hypothetical protein